MTETLMSVLFHDTDPEAERTLIDLIRAQPVWKRLAQVDALYETCRTLALAELRGLNPQATDAELRRLLVARVRAGEPAPGQPQWPDDMPDR
jgi:hypothetical protein